MHGAGSKESPTVSDKQPVDIGRLILEGTRVDEAIRKAVQDTLRLHKKLGDPVVAWKDGKVVWIPAAEIELEEPDPELDSKD
jgi:hypothetical protein